MLKNNFIFILITLSSSLSIAIDSFQKCLKTSDLVTRISYLNGINKNFSLSQDSDEVDISVKEIKKNIKPQDNSKLIFDRIKNSSTDIKKDIMRTYIQKITEGNQGFGFFIPSNYLLKYIANFTQRDNFDQINKNIRTRVLSGEKLIIVSHSQGNLYANEVCKDIKSDQYFSSILKEGYPFINVQVATPADAIECGTKYTSLISDVVIMGTAFIGMNPLSKIKIPLLARTSHSDDFNKSDSEKDITDHGFLESYLADPKVAKKIYSDIESEIRAFNFHGRNEPIASYMVRGCLFPNSERSAIILCKDAKEGDSVIKFNNHCEGYEFIGKGNISNDEIKFSATAPKNLPTLK